jgi:PhnB protein
MQIIPHLNFNGQCREAFETYEKVLGGKINFMMTWAEMPGADQFPPEMHKLIMHATIAVGDQLIMGADSPPDRYEKPQGLWVSVNLKDAAEAERIFNALADNGSIMMPFQQTFWSPGFGMCTDRFGTPWMVNTEAPAQS